MQAVSVLVSFCPTGVSTVEEWMHYAFMAHKLITTFEEIEEIGQALDRLGFKAGGTPEEILYGDENLSAEETIPDPPQA
jgi:hypothetical protein